ncbi:GNAT family N-acetyltransferase [Gracilibacillus timonensis]|uniref:GNAT family N-acetyltransferase n=1 Tax=Gracilibacillus timonensis TaxID=1816696 RepID=UPI0008268C96|nr:GNAT family N-acetyltransferase [Gracilibacillus timonensis]
MYQLVKPSLAYVEQIAAYKESFQQHNEKMHGSNFLSKADSIEQWIKDVDIFWDKATVPEGLAPCGTWILIRESDQQLLGISNLRFELSTVFLQQYAGHIGYSIKPTERGQGYGTKILELTLKEAQKKAIAEVLLICGDDNISSAKVIEANNGKLEKKVWDEVDEEWIRRYWIAL